MLFGLIPSGKKLIYILGMSAVLACFLLYVYFGAVKLFSCIGLTFALAIIVTCVRTKNIPMAVAHLGLAITIIGISITPAYEIEHDLRLQFGQHIHLAGYDITFNGINNIDGPNYIGFVGDFEIFKNNQLIAKLYPEKRTYLAREITMTETAILPGLLKDIYIALGQQFASNSWTARIYYKPFVRWIWLGAIIMACGVAYGIGRKLYIDNFAKSS
jgi:cytochrome c biogenesis factor